MSRGNRPFDDYIVGINVVITCGHNGDRMRKRGLVGNVSFILSHLIIYLGWSWLVWKRNVSIYIYNYIHTLNTPNLDCLNSMTLKYTSPAHIFQTKVVCFWSLRSLNLLSRRQPIPSSLLSYLPVLLYISLIWGGTCFVSHDGCTTISVGMMKFRIYGKTKLMFQTTNQLTIVI